VPGDILTPLKLSLLFLAAFGSSAAAQQSPPYQFAHYAVSFAPGATDAGGHRLGGTEVRDLVAFNGKLYAGVGYWMDQGTQGNRTAQVLVLDAPDAQWRQDVDFASFCPPDNQRCALATGALSSLNFKRDAGGDSVDVNVLVASVWPTGKKPPEGNSIRVYMKNNSDQLWYETALASTQGNAQVRSFGSHQDQVTKDALAFAAGGDIGIYHGLLADKRSAGKPIIEWRTGADQAEYNFLGSEGACGGGRRIMAFAEAEGSLYATECFDLLERIDGAQGNCKPDEVSIPAGCEPRWRKIWTLPNPPGSQSGFRGMTTVGANGQQWLLLGIESGSRATITRYDPLTNTAQTELDVSETLSQAWDSPSGYVITSYSAPMPLWYGADGHAHRIIGLEAFIDPSKAAPTPGHSLALLDRGEGAGTGGNLEGEGWYFVRDAAWSYRLFRLPPITANRMVAVRAAASSPFPSECDAKGLNCAIYFGGFDANSAKSMQSCFSPPCGVLPSIPVTDTAWIVKGYF
jgi:hypothetical protein